jgi:hypothetical protein
MRGKNSDDSVEASGDGTASLQLRDVENAGVVSRRGVLWRAGLATAAGVGVLSVLDEQRAEANTGGNFILGQGNVANATTSLAPNGQTTPLMQVNGASLSATSTTMVVNGPNGGAALGVTGGSTATTVGLAINGTGSGTATGVYGASGSGTGLRGVSSTGAGVYGSSSSNAGVQGVSSSSTGVVGSSGTADGVHGTTATAGKYGVVGTSTSPTGGTGVYGTSPHGVGIRASSSSGTALYVSGKTHFSRSGSGTVATGNTSVIVNVSGLTSSNLVLATLQKKVSGVYLLAAVATTGHFTVYLNKSAPANIKFAWFVLN